jgi:hypothetical protein
VGTAAALRDGAVGLGLVVAVGAEVRDAARGEDGPGVGTREVAAVDRKTAQVTRPQ